MKTEQIKAAVKDAKKFIDRANEVLKEREASSYYGIVGTAKSGALRRASLDLTRQLSEMRKP
jgi:non-canonical (house-cleaning) NTP pyrophosphatase